MSVYKRAGAQTYSYDFRLKRRRFSGDTERASRREAQAVEREQRERARTLVAEDAAFEKPLTWELASSRYWLEVGQFHKNRETTLKALDWLSRHLGKSTMVSAIDDNRIAGLVRIRRAEPRAVGSKATRDAAAPVSPATVNRTMTEPLRKVLLRASRIWGVRVARINWREHILDEPRERVREASAGEQQAIAAMLERGYEEVLAFAMRDGCRRAEICHLTWDRVDFFGKRYTVIGKGDRARTIPMSQATYDQFKRLLGQHPVYVFTFVALKTRKEFGQVRTHRYPINPTNLSHVLKAAAMAAGVANFHLHDTRHTAATRTLRRSNLRVVQQLLGHRDIATTTRYTHAFDDDIRAALDAASSAAETPPTKSAATEDYDSNGKTGRA